ncbi:MAG: hypothetical protein H7Y20_01650 [Bryobacteraceae bacterium]|nr:hypothetical protein [Bryobacteraceae bacterium]
MRIFFVRSLIVFFIAHSSFAQPAPVAAEVAPPALKTVPKITDAETEAFLKTAAVTARKTSTIGTTAPSRATLSDGKLTHEAQIQCVDVFQAVWKGSEGSVEKNFRDTYKFNIAAYRLGRMLNILNIPMSVERDLEGKLCGVTWWVDNVWMTEAERRDRGIKPPTTDEWVNQLNTVRVFDQLIYNTDRNQGNLLITPDWKIWMIDHTRAFRTFPTLMKVEPLRRIPRDLLKALKSLNTMGLKQELGPWLRPEEISAILARRDLIVKFFASEIRGKGEESVLTGIPRTTPAASVP